MEMETRRGGEERRFHVVQPPFEARVVVETGESDGRCVTTTAHRLRGLSSSYLWTQYCL
jgi:hypothetical protein